MIRPCDQSDLAAIYAIINDAAQAYRGVIPAEKDRLLGKYWSIPKRQVETSVVLADERWFAARQGAAAEGRGAAAVY